jgi:hypothetical protein
MQIILPVLLLLIVPVQSLANCLAPGQDFLAVKIKEAFHIDKGEQELKEWVQHPKNSQARHELRTLDRRFKFAQFRSQRESILEDSKNKFEEIIENNQRADEIEHFPVQGTQSKLKAEPGSLSIEMKNLTKDELDFFPKEVLDKLDTKVSVKYFFPYDRFEYDLSYEGKQLPMDQALNKIQGEMEASCAQNMRKNHEDREWYNKDLTSNKLAPYKPKSNSVQSGHAAGQ